MEPRIQYCTAPDGVNLAFCTEGQGPPLVFMPPYSGVGHMQLDRFFPVSRRLFDYLSARMTVVQYDHRGQGLSDRTPADSSIEPHVGDVLTIFDRLGLERAALLARAFGGPVGITFARRYPERGTVRELARTSAAAAFDDRGEHQLKGIADAVRVYAVRQGGG